MEEDGEETPSTPFWIQSTNVRRVELYRRRASSLFFNAGVLIVILLLFAVVSMVFIIPSVISFTSNIFRPNLVKRSWDSINLVLVLFALAFGFLGRNINNDQKPRFDRSRSDLSTGVPVASPSSSTPHQWYAFPEQPIGGLRRHRSTSSYPDLRELSPPWNHGVEAPWRFSDDTHLNNHRVLNYDRYYFRREQDLDTKEVHVDTVMDLPKEDSYVPPPQPPIPEEETYTPLPQPPIPEEELYAPTPQPPAPEDELYPLPQQLPSPQSLPPQPPAPRPSGRKKAIRTLHNIAADDRGESSRSEFNQVLSPETEQPAFQDSERKGQTIRKRGKGERRRAKSSEHYKPLSPINDPEQDPPSPPQISPVFLDSEQKPGRVERKRTGANATKEFFTSFYLKRKKKRQRQRSVDNLDNLLRHPQPPLKFQLPPPSPPPPPPPPPPSVLNNLFTSKKERRKKIPSAAAPPPPTPPPPPPPPRTAARAPKPTITRVSPFVTEKPRGPVKMSFFNGIDDSSSGGESPMSRIPPPPPMPPFKMPDWKFAVEGDYVRVQSTLSSGSVSPDGDEALSPSSAVATPLFCPSPDVDTKADSFIARFRAGLKLEKINSFNKNQSFRMSNLGPGPTSSNN